MSFWITHFLGSLNAVLIFILFFLAHAAAFVWTAFSMIEITDLQIANFLVFSILRGFFFSVTMIYIIYMYAEPRLICQ